jgi:hypothetical protein
MVCCNLSEDVLPLRNEKTEPVFLNFYGAQESIPGNRFRQSMKPGGPAGQTYSYSVPSPHRLFKNSSTDLDPVLLP